MGSATLLTLVLLWTCALVVGLQLAFAARAWFLERREGLRVSSRRLVALGAIFGVVFVLVLASSIPVGSGVPAGSVGEPLDPTAEGGSTGGAETAGGPGAMGSAARQDCSSLLAEIEECSGPCQEILTARLGEPEAGGMGDEEVGGDAVATSDGQPAAGAEDAVAGSAGIIAAIRGISSVLVPLLSFVGFAVLLMSGDPRTLLMGGREGETGGDEGDEHLARARKDLKNVAQALLDRQPLDGLHLADTLDRSRLDHLERLELQFLRSCCVVQLFDSGRGEDNVPRDPERSEMLGKARSDLEALLLEAPNRTEAAYVLGLVLGLMSQHESALQVFEASETLPRRADLPVARNISVCHLFLAERCLSENRVDDANLHFDRIAKLKVLSQQVPQALLKVRLGKIRRNLEVGEFGEAVAGIESVRALEDLPEETRVRVQLLCDAYSALIPYRQNDDERAREVLETFLGRHLPDEMPEIDEETAREMWLSPIEEDDLPLPRAALRAFLFVQAVVNARLIGRAAPAVESGHLDRLTLPLLRALQFEPGHKEALGALGGIYFWFDEDRRAEGLEFLETAMTLGSRSKVVRTLVRRHQVRAMENRELLEWFQSASSRFLQDPTLTAKVREALMADLGRFQEFQPLLLDLEGLPSEEPREPTVALLRQRARYVDGLARELLGRQQGEAAARLAELQRDFVRHLENLSVSHDRIQQLEREMVTVMGKVVLG